MNLDQQFQIKTTLTRGEGNVKLVLWNYIVYFIGNYNLSHEFCPGRA